MPISSKSSASLSRRGDVIRNKNTCIERVVRNVGFLRDTTSEIQIHRPTAMQIKAGMLAEFVHPYVGGQITGEVLYRCEEVDKSIKFLMKPRNAIYRNCSVGVESIISVTTKKS